MYYKFVEAKFAVVQNWKLPKVQRIGKMLCIFPMECLTGMKKDNSYTQQYG